MDLFVANGHIYPELDEHPEIGEPYPQQNQLFVGGSDGRVTELDVTHPGPHYLLARLLRKDGHGDEAGRELELFRRTKQAAAHVELAANASGAGHHDLAVVELRRALEAYPEHPRALFLLALELARRGEREEAAECLRRVIGLRLETREAVAHDEALLREVTAHDLTGNLFPGSPVI